MKNAKLIDRMRAALELALTNDNASCYKVNTKEAYRRRIKAINDEAREALTAYYNSKNITV